MRIGGMSSSRLHFDFKSFPIFEWDENLKLPHFLVTRTLWSLTLFDIHRCFSNTVRSGIKCRYMLRADTKYCRVSGDVTACVKSHSDSSTIVSDHKPGYHMVYKLVWLCKSMSANIEVTISLTVLHVFANRGSRVSQTYTPILKFTI